MTSAWPLLGLVCGLVLTPSAHAQTIVLAKPYVVEGASPYVVRVIVESATAKLRARGFVVLASSDETEPCSHNLCALKAAADSAADLTLTLSVFAKPWVSFSLSFVLPPNHTFLEGVRGLERLDDATVQERTERAVDSLIAQYRRGPGPWLRIDGSPANARVRLDGQTIGVTPLRARIEGGEHVIDIQAEGYRAFRDTLWLEGSAGSEKLLHVNLQRAPDGRADLAPPFSARGVGAIAFVLAAGAAHLGAGATLLLQGTDTRLARSLTAVGGASTALGAAAFTVALAGHMRVGARVSRNAATLTGQHSF